MKRFEILLPMTVAILFLSIWLAACDKDNDKNESQDLVKGVWNMSNIEVDATPVPNAMMSEAEIEAVYSNYTFFMKGSQVIFQGDSISFIASLGDLDLPMKLPYTLTGNTLTIKAELAAGVELQIRGEVDFNDNDSFDFDITRQSYMSVLQFISGMGMDENLTRCLTQTMSAEAEFTLDRVKN